MDEDGVARTVGELTATLASASTPERAQHERAYLKSQLDFLGTPVPVIRRVARSWVRANPALPSADIWRVVDALWATRTHECWQVGTAILERVAPRLPATDLRRVERLLRQGQSWAHIDWLATAVAAPLVWRSAKPLPRLRRWSRDRNFWVRRTALLCYLPRLRAHSADITQFCELAEPLLDEQEFFIRKAIGWVLRQAVRQEPDAVAMFLERHLARVSGVTFREAVKYLPAARQRELARSRARLP